ncbi:MAG: MCE family protein [Phycisphaeraceae bacterium]|nr:MAG: MCE family protein [Phycisphaeraceae bacterium]
MPDDVTENRGETNPVSALSPPEPPLARVTPRRFSLVWLVPILALAGLGALLFHQLGRERGPVIEITFTRAEGLEPGADIVHRGITVGVVRDVRLTDDLAGVRVTAELHPHATKLASEGAQFWVVRPEVSLSRIAGIETILGPRYIAVRPAPEGAPRARTFAGLDTPPTDAPPVENALVLTLTAPRVGSLAPGSPVLFRDVPVGSIRDIALAEDATHVTLTAAIDPEYATLVRENSRFWVVSGMGVDWGLFRGLSVRAESLESLIRSAVSFATPNRPGARVADRHAFELADAPRDDWLEWDPPIPLHATED